MIGDLQVGYELVTIEYLDASLHGTTTAKLVDFNLCDPEHELVSDEIDFAAGTPLRLEQRFSFWPGFLFAAQFSDVRISRQPVEHRHV